MIEPLVVLTSESIDSSKSALLYNTALAPSRGLSLSSIIEISKSLAYFLGSGRLFEFLQEKVIPVRPIKNIKTIFFMTFLLYCKLILNLI